MGIILNHAQSYPYRILCLVGTRPESIKMAPVIRKLRTQSWAKVTVISTGQHGELVSQILDMFGVSIDHDMKVMHDNQTLSGLSSRIFGKLDQLLDDKRFDLVLVQGDTTSVLMIA
jgi:UDP-N-acetylglucosamine 2-epimerase (non-hydrolysing)